MRSYCREMIFRVRNKQQHLQPPREEERRGHKHRGRQGGRERTETRRKVVAEDEWRNYRERNVPLPDCTERERQQPSLNLRCQGPDVQPVPPQVISMLRLKTFKEEMRRVWKLFCVIQFFHEAAITVENALFLHLVCLSFVAGYRGGAP